MPSRDYWARKPIADMLRDVEARPLARTLGPASIVAIGHRRRHFVLTGTAAAQSLVLSIA